MFNYWELVLAWALYFTIHSLWASTHFKNWISNYFPFLKSWYRIIFNFFAIVLFIPVYWIFKNTVPNDLLFDPATGVKILGGIGVIWGLYLGKVGFNNYSSNEFFGFYQLKNHHEFHPIQLSTEGLNGIVRHPLYFAGIILMWSLFLISPSKTLLISNAMISLYLYIGTLFEEKKLMMDFGDSYKAYKKNVSMLIPLKWLKQKIVKTR